MRETVLYQWAQRHCEGVRRDRGCALYVAKSVQDGSIFRIEGRKDNLFALHLTEKCLFLLAQSLPFFAEDDLYTCLLRRKGQSVTEKEMAFLTQCVKQYEMQTPFPAKTEREIRQMCAECLRTGTGGGTLYLARALMMMEE